MPSDGGRARSETGKANERFSSRHTSRRHAFDPDGPAEARSPSATRFVGALLFHDIEQVLSGKRGKIALHQLPRSACRTHTRRSAGIFQGKMPGMSHRTKLHVAARNAPASAACGRLRWMPHAETRCSRDLALQHHRSEEHTSE